MPSRADIVCLSSSCAFVWGPRRGCCPRSHHLWSDISQVGLDFFFHNIMVHVPRHVDMRIPFYHLPEAARVITAAFPDVVREGKRSLFHYARFTKQCKLSDFEKGQWRPYPS